MTARFPKALARRPETVRKVLAALARTYPEAHCELEHQGPLQLLVATILSAQCTDKRVNLVTRELFKKYRTPGDFAGAPPGELEKDIHSTGFYRAKAKSIRSACKDLMDKFGGQVPRTLEELTGLHGVGRKTANVVLGNAYGVPGITVDTHVGRISRLLGWTRQEDPVKVERELMALWPRKDWTMISHRMIFHGRRCCVARRPDCPRCPLARWCPSRLPFSLAGEAPPR